MPSKSRDFIQYRVKAATSTEAIEKFLAACRQRGHEPVDVLYLRRLNLGEWEGVTEILDSNNKNNKNI